MTIYKTAQLSETYEDKIAIGLIQDESSEWAVYKNLISAINQSIDIILLPQYAIPVYIEEQDNLQEDITNTAKENEALIVFGSKSHSNSSQGYYNTAFIMNTPGSIIHRYAKMNPIQFFQDGDPGTEYTVTQTKFGKIGVLICYDMNYSYVARNLVDNGAEFLLIPTYNAMRWSSIQHQQHSAMTNIRAVENGRFVARTSTSGISQIIDPSGRVTDQIPIGISSSIVGYMHPISKPTFYTFAGYCIPYICLILTVLLITKEAIKKFI